MADRLSRLDDQDPVCAFLLAADPANCGAQAVFLERGVFSKEINAKLQQQLASYSAQALAHLLKVSSEVELGARGSRPVASASDVASPAGSDPSVRVAQLLWSDKFGASLTARLSEPHSLEKQADSVLLAATIPQDTMRASLWKTFRKHWPEGPTIVGTGDVTSKIVTDPGFLVLLKMFPRKSDSKPGVRTPPARSRPGRSLPNSGAVAGKKAPEKKEQAEKDWMTLSSKLTTAWCARLQTAAQARDKAEAEAGTVSANAAHKLPSEFETAHGAKLVTAYHLVWPAEVSAEMAATPPSPLEIYYLRIEETAKPKKAIGYYARQWQLKTPEARKTDTSNKTDWLDSVRTLGPNNHRRSVDVLLTRADNKGTDAAKDKDNEEIDLVVEILTIEIKDPASRE